MNDKTNGSKPMGYGHDAKGAAGGVNKGKGKPGVSDAAQEHRNGHAGHDRQVEERPDGRPDHLGVVDVDAGVADQDRVGSGRIRAADDRAGIARVTDVGEDHQEPRVTVQDRIEIDIDGPADRDDPLRDLRVTHGSENLVAHLAGGQTSRPRCFEHRSMPVGPRLDVEVLDHVRPVRDDLAHSLRTLREEET